MLPSWRLKATAGIGHTLAAVYMCRCANVQKIIYTTSAPSYLVIGEVGSAICLSLGR